MTDIKWDFPSEGEIALNCDGAVVVYFVIFMGFDIISFVYFVVFICRILLRPNQYTQVGINPLIQYIFIKKY